MTFHRWVIHDQVPDYVRLGWIALPTLEGTNHGIYSTHCVWLCECPLPEPEGDVPGQDEDDGQPDEMQEWQDYDPEC